MTLISMLLVLTIERVTTQSRYWQADFYLDKYQEILDGQDWISEKANAWMLFALLFLPAILLYIVMHQVDSVLLTLLINTAVLMVCIGCPSLRATYKCYLQAANRGDMEACSLYADQLGHVGEQPETFGQQLVWLNYRHYAAVLIWFVAFGAAGAVFYTLSRGFQSRLADREHPLVEQTNSLMQVLDWVPVRITALGFLLVGHFSRALPVWLLHLPDPAIPARRLLAEVCKAAEDVEPDEHDCTEEPCTLVKLAKRNIMFIMVVISVMTLSGLVN